MNAVVWGEFERIGDGLFMACFKTLILYLLGRNKEDR
jgi:hypothetical protein